MGLPVPFARLPVEAVADAVIDTEPTKPPVTVKVATPPAALTEPRPVTVPVPDVLENVTLRVLSAPEVMVLPFASWIVAVRTRVLPAVKSVVEPLSASFAAGPGGTVTVTAVPDPPFGVPLPGLVMLAMIVPV